MAGFLNADHQPLEPTIAKAAGRPNGGSILETRLGELVGEGVIADYCVCDAGGAVLLAAAGGGGVLEADLRANPSLAGQFRAAFSIDAEGAEPCGSSSHPSVHQLECGGTSTLSIHLCRSGRLAMSSHRRTVLTLFHQQMVEPCLSLWWPTNLVSQGSFPLQSRRICTANPACQLGNNLRAYPTWVRQVVVLHDAQRAEVGGRAAHHGHPLRRLQGAKVFLNLTIKWSLTPFDEVI